MEGVSVGRMRKLSPGSPSACRHTAGVLAIGRIVSPLQRELYRGTAGRLSLTDRAPVLLLTTTAPRTGKARTVPLYIRDGDRLVVCNVNPGFERLNPGLNLRAEPRAQVQLGRRPARSWIATGRS